MKKHLLIFISFLFPFCFFGQVSVNNNSPYNSPNYLVNDILIGANCVNTSNISFQGDPMQLGYFQNSGYGTDPFLDIENGIVISTGDVNIIDPSFSNYVFNPSK